jgi:hypothetical protein
MIQQVFEGSNIAILCPRVDDRFGGALQPGSHEAVGDGLSASAA